VHQGKRGNPGWRAAARCSVGILVFNKQHTFPAQLQVDGHHDRAIPDYELWKKRGDQFRSLVEYL
jgi:hypothetical protein